MMEQETSFVDKVLDGETPHSPEQQTPPADGTKAAPEAASQKPEQAPHAEDSAAKAPENTVPAIGEEEDSPFADSTRGQADDVSKPRDKPKDEKPVEVPPSPEVEKLQQQVKQLEKRLHDTQAGFHRVSEEKSSYEKELAELKKKKDNDDDWFGNDDEKRQSELEAKIKEADGKLQVYEDEKGKSEQEKQQAEQAYADLQWDNAAAPVIKEHPDFDKVVYDFLGKALRENNPGITELWNKQCPDKHPKAVYAFAKGLMEKAEMLNNPEAYRNKIRTELKQELGITENNAPVGKQGLDALNSASADYSPKNSGDVSFVDSIFK